MKQIILAQRYLNAFIKNVTPEKREIALTQVIGMGNVVYSQKKLLSLLSNPIVPLDKKNDILMKVAQIIAVDVLVLNLFKLMLQKNRISAIGDLISQAKEMLPIITNKIDVEVAVPKGFKQIDESKITQLIESIVTMDTKITVTEDDALTGGFRAQAGFLVFDGSLENSLKKFLVSLN